MRHYRRAQVKQRCTQYGGTRPAARGQSAGIKAGRPKLFNSKHRAGTAALKITMKSLVVFFAIVLALSSAQNSELVSAGSAVDYGTATLMQFMNESKSLTTHRR